VVQPLPPLEELDDEELDDDELDEEDEEDEVGPTPGPA